MDYHLFNSENALEKLPTKSAKGNLQPHTSEIDIPSHAHSDTCVFESSDHTFHPAVFDFIQPNSTYSKTMQAVMQFINKGRSPKLENVTRTHRVDLDWLFG